MIEVIRSGHVVTKEEAGTLCGEVTNEEIKGATWSIRNDRAPGFDGFDSYFFKKAWSIMGRDVVMAIKEFFETKRVLKQFNSTHSLLCPKFKVLWG